MFKRLALKEKRQSLKRWFLCWQWGCEPEDDGTWWRGGSGRVVLLEPKPCKRCKTMIGGPEDGAA
jgi:hypothetical protein